MFEGNTRPDVNVRSPAYYIARTLVLCSHCRSMTTVVALVVPPEHETLDTDAPVDEEGDGDSDRDYVGSSVVNISLGDWQRAGVNAFLFYAEYLPDSVQDRLQNLSPSFRFAYSDATLSSYWANHCDHCERLLGDHELHCEPEGAFMPVSETAAAGIELLRIDEPFEAAAAGYAFEPEFFSLIRGA